jgi:outer membrane protein OmpA-like peptidoglycan-associated protein
MKWARVCLSIAVLMLGTAGQAWAQDEGIRPATTTFWGDTGLWFVPTGEVLPTGTGSVSVQRTEFDFRQGNTNVSFFPVTGAFGMGAAEVFGAMRVVTRIDRDTVPLLFAGPENEAGGLVNEFPTVSDSWTGNQLGDLFLGGKFNLLSQSRQQPFALAARGTVKFPTGDEDAGAGTGEYDYFLDGIASGEAGGVELSGFSGFAWRGDPDEISIGDSVRWGVGAGFPSRSSVRVMAELHGEWMLDDQVLAPAGLIVGEDGSLSPATSRVKDPVNATFGLTWQHPSGVLLGAALNYRFGLETEEAQGIPANDQGDALGVEFRIGFHRGVPTYVAPPPPVALAPEPAPEPIPAPQPAPAPAPPANRPPTVRAICEPCTLGVGGTAMLRADASDPDGDPLTIMWTATGGTLAATRGVSTEWRAETAPGLITFTASVDDGRGGRASDTVTIEVSAGEDAFEDVLFDFDSSRLKPDAQRILEPVIAAMTAQPAMDLEIQGHTCNVGTTEYNLALGERRARAVRDYLVSRGIAASRLSTISYGEERPAADNSTAASRRLNRRATMVVHATDLEESTR